MHPTEMPGLYIVGALILVILLLSLRLEKKWKKIGWSIAGILFFGYSIFLIVRPYWIDSQIEKKVELLEAYLIVHYPEEQWEIKTVPHRQKGYKHLNPYYIGVIFENEPDVIYHYWVENENDIYQVAFTTNSRLERLEFKE